MFGKACSVSDSLCTVHPNGCSANLHAKSFLLSETGRADLILGRRYHAVRLLGLDVNSAFIFTLRNACL